MESDWRNSTTSWQLVWTYSPNLIREQTKGSGTGGREGGRERERERERERGEKGWALLFYLVGDSRFLDRRGGTGPQTGPMGINLVWHRADIGVLLTLSAIIFPRAVSPMCVGHLTLPTRSWHSITAYEVCLPSPLLIHKAILFWILWVS
jgi:hypothetical protein